MQQINNWFKRLMSWFFKPRFIGKPIVRELTQEEWEIVKQSPTMSKFIIKTADYVPDNEIWAVSADGSDAVKFTNIGSDVDDLFELELQQSLAAYQTKRVRLIADHKQELHDMERQFHKERASKIKDYKKQQADRPDAPPPQPTFKV
jgi:hypothetical protein